MSKKKIYIFITSIVLAFSLSLGSASAATYTASARREGNLETTYRYGFNYSTVLGYNSPGNGLIYSASDLKFSGQTCKNQVLGSYGCRTQVSQVSKSINSNQRAVTFRVEIMVHIINPIGIPIYVGTKYENLTVSSPGPSRMLEDVKIKVEEGETHINPDIDLTDYH